MDKYVAIGAGCAGLLIAYLAYKGAGKAVEVVKDAAQAINPLNYDNIINKGVESVYQTVTGSDGTIGGDFYDATHGGILSNGTFNPTSTNNAINKGVESIGEWITGEKGWTLGGQIYDWTH